jgi:hypothetical protein
MIIQTSKQTENQTQIWNDEEFCLTIYDSVHVLIRGISKQQTELSTKRHHNCHFGNLFFTICFF